MDIFAFVVYMIAILIVSLYLAMHYKIEIEECVPLCFFCIAEIVFLFGLFDKLRLGIYACIAFSVVCLGLLIRDIVDKNSDVNLRSVFAKIFTPGVMIAGALIVWTFATCYGRLVYHGDDVAHWANAAKKMFYLDAFHCIPGAGSRYSEYPPGMQLIELVPSVLTGKFTEWHLFAILNLYMVSLYLPFIKRITIKQWYYYVPALLIGMIGGALGCQDSSSLQVDIVLAMTMAYGFAAMLEIDGRKTLKYIKVIMAANMLILIKSAGLLFATILIICFIASEIPSVKKCGKKQILYLALSVVPFITSLLWRIKWKSGNGTVQFNDSKYDISEFIGIIIGKITDDVKSQIFHDFIDYFSFFDSRVLSKSYVACRYVLPGAILLIICICIAYKKEGLYKWIVAVSGLTVGCIVYIVGMLASYMYTFGATEAKVLASIARYFNIYYAVLFYFILYVMTERIVYYDKKSGILAIAGVLIMLGCVDEAYVTGTRIYRWRSEVYRQPYERAAEVIRKDIQNNEGNKDADNVVIVSCEEKWPLTFAYVLYPTISVAGLSSDYGNGGDVMAYIEEKDAEYLVTFAMDEEFHNRFDSFFDAVPEDGQVYRVEDNGKLVLIGP